MEELKRDKYDSIQMVIDLVSRMVNDLGYTEDEAWETVSNKLLNDLETHTFEKKQASNEATGQSDRTPRLRSKVRYVTGRD